jgi:hypothetical protein
MSTLLSRKLLSHRGLWGAGVSPNSEEALTQAFEKGFGVETDLRESKGKIGISHDPILVDQGVVQMKALENLVEVGKKFEGRGPIALNVKSDGLLDLKLSEALEGLQNYFLFDMSTPEQVRFARAGLPFSIRISEFETFETSSRITKIAKPAAIWLDGFSSDWYLEKRSWTSIMRHSEKIPVVIVGPELHGRNPQAVIEAFLTEVDNPNLLLCTDNPGEVLNGAL